MENEVYKVLEFSYTRLNDENLQQCLLYCALFPEDYEIRRVDLIKYWIAEGFVDEMETRIQELDRGRAMLNKLENVCLLERCKDGSFVKMHDVIRDMAINISTKNRRFMVKAGRHLNDLPREMKQSKNLERVSLMHSRISSLISAPISAKLSTMFLQGSPQFRMPDLNEVPNAFFSHLKGLKVLDLSFRRISSLPDSISDLLNLRALYLSCCYELKHVPSLAKLKELRDLDLSCTAREAVPEGTEKLILLKRLALRNVGIKDMSLSRALPYLLHLQCLILDDFMEAKIYVEVEHLMSLRKLEILSVEFSSLQQLSSYVKTEHYRILAHYFFKIIGTPDAYPVEVSERKVVVQGLAVKQEIQENGDYQLVFPNNMQVLVMGSCFLPTGLPDVFPSRMIHPDLKRCDIINCSGIEYLFRIEDYCPSLSSLCLHSLPNLTVLFKFKMTSYPCFCGLKKLFICDCPNIKYMFTTALVKHHLQNLKLITVYNCRGMKEIIVAEEDGQEEINGILRFHNLLALELHHLRDLESIWKGTISCDSLQQITVLGCPKLTRLPFSVYIDDSDGNIPTSTPALNKINGRRDWWDTVEWDGHPRAKSVFPPLFTDDYELSSRGFADDEGKDEAAD